MIQVSWEHNVEFRSFYRDDAIILKRMENSSGNGNQTTPQSYVKCETPLDGYQLVIMSAFDVAISIAAILGNILILIAFRKVSARVLHPPSKLLFECLAYSDLSVSLVLQPLRIISYNSYENTESCFYALFASWIVGNIFMWSFSPYTNCNRCG